MKIKLSNDFHGTSATVEPQLITEGRFRGLHRISRKTMLRLRRCLCGQPACRCGDTFGARCSAHLAVVNEDSNRDLVVDLDSSHYQSP